MAAFQVIKENWFLPLSLLLLAGAFNLGGCATVSQVLGIGPGFSRGDYPSSSQDISYGMLRSEVRSIWGEPMSVEFAGGRSHGNERWTYAQPQGTGWGPSRVVYFEQGEVVGWDVAQATSYY